MTRDELRRALEHPNVKAFLLLIRKTESSLDDRAYGMRYGGVGRPVAYFSDFTQHPRRFEPTPGGQQSSAAGAYQITATTWDSLCRQYGFTDFTPATQDEAAVALIAGRGALDEVLAGNVARAVELCRKEWTSLPGAAESRRSWTVKGAIQFFEEHGGVATQDAAPIIEAGKPYEPEPVEIEQAAPTVIERAGLLATPEKKMAPFLLAPILQLIPSLIGIFGKGDRAKTNEQAAQVVVDAFTQAVPGATNAQDAIEKAQQDPVVLDEARRAMMQMPAILALQEVGGGIPAARLKELQDQANPQWWRPLTTPSFVVAVLLLIAAGFIIWHVVLNSTGVWTAQDRSQILMLAVAVISGVMGYYLGSSLGSARKDEIIDRR